MTISYEQLRSERKDKERNIYDLADYINNRADRVPNYSLLLGAGCSISSKIRPASELIEAWKKEIFISENGEESISHTDLSEKINAFFESKENVSWYDARNQYSSLFEHKYDLPQQRRKFVELEVRDKYPSLGYAYLINLVKEKFFNTIFTTNFDDLINEAFYQFSDERPIVCAHDSSINSITVTSRRPKVIKLHGDYLFDDIKSTPVETESLEENMKNKFIEFSKDFGLVVVGYSGNDRSVMDVISQLLKNEQYFKNGIYWCLREDSNISGELRKLFWQDRVYYVKIDGFDEMMAELNCKINKGVLPIDTYNTTSKAVKIVSNLINSDFIKTNTNSIINKDLERLKMKQKTDAIDVVANVFNENEVVNQAADGIANESDNISLLTKENISTLNKINIFIKSSDYKMAEGMIDVEVLKEDSNVAYKKELYLARASMMVEQVKVSEAIKSYQALSKLSPKNAIHLLNIATLSSDFEDKMAFLEKALEIDPYDYRIYAEKAKAIGREIGKRNHDQNSSLEQELFSTLESGINVYPVVKNSCYAGKFDYLYSKIEHGDKEFCINECQAIIDYLKDQNPFSPTLVNMSLDLMLIQLSKQDKINYEDTSHVYSYLLKCESDVSSRYLQEIISLKLKYARKVRDKFLIKQIIADYEAEFNFTSRFCREKSAAMLSVNKDLNGAISAQQKAIELTGSPLYKARLATLYMYDKNFDKAKSIAEELIEYNPKILEWYYNELDDYDKAIELNIQNSKKHSDFIGFSIERSYYHLMNDDYIGAYELLSKFSNIDVESLIPYTVNYELSRLGVGKKIRKEKVSRLIKENECTLGQAALHCLLKEYQKANDIINQCVDADYENVFTIRRWPVFNELRKCDFCTRHFHD